MATNFSNVQNPTVGDYASFLSIAGNANIHNNHNHNHNYSQRDRITVNGKTIRVVMDSDIHCLRLQSSKILSVNVKPDDEASTSSESQVVRLKKMVQTAEVSGWQGRYTATTLEPVDEEDQDLFKKIVKSTLQMAVCHRSALLTQVFAVTESDAMTMLTYNELANTDEISRAYAVQSLRDDKALTFPVADRDEDWSIDLKTLTWHYNPANISLIPPSEEDLRPYPTRLPPLRRDAVPQLNSTEIIAHVEKNLGDFLYLIAAGGGRWINDLSNWAQNGLLTFGAVVQHGRPGTLAHFPSTPTPKLFCESFSPDVEASYSNSGRVDLSLQKTGNVKVNLRFGLRIPNNDLRVAYLCQSLPFYDGCHDVEKVVYIDQVGFRLEGIFCEDLTTRSKPAYLFIPPLHTELIGGLHCLRYPLSRNISYWSNDPQGRDEIAKKDWERLRIPKLRVQGLIGTKWRHYEYTGVRELLYQKNCTLDGKQYACERGYPELIPGDPHDTTRFKELKSSESDSEPETPPSPSRLTSPSTYSLVEAPLEANLECEDAPLAPTSKEITVTPTRWVRGFLNRYYKSLDRSVTVNAPKVTRRVDLSLQKTGNVKVNLRFGLRIPNNDLCVAYLCQSLPFYDGCHDVEKVVYIDQVGFRLEGIFCEDLTTRPKPAYLFIRPLHTKLINGLHCFRYPPSQNIFYWSNDPQGREKIAEKDWERLRIPKLRVQGLIGTCWKEYGYTSVREILHQKNRDSDGKQYARERGYPELIPGDPHDSTRFKELESSEPDSEPETPPSPSRLTSPSTYSLVEAPLEPKLESEDAPTVPTSKEIMVTPTRWVRGFLNKFCTYLFNFAQRREPSSLKHSDNTPDRSVNTPKVAGTEELSDEWALVSREDV
ncbi:hypothetical protein PQX77_021072 [Marasmius sp. AFHP31]|nr:hypothetical protein PQX77_021072 [Marasmius sp. AFHP31]